MELDDFQTRAQGADQFPSGTRVESDLITPEKHEVIPLLGLVGEVGALLAEYKKLLRDGGIHEEFREHVAEELGDILWYVANVATKFGYKLNDIAERNLAKVADRWHQPMGPRILYDENLAGEERLPRVFKYRFETREYDGVGKVVLVDLMDGADAGDPLTDNSVEDDGYRFHDVLHLTFAACLGWSPVYRKLLRKRRQLKNRTPPIVDEVEDGGRSQVIDEAIVAAAYGYASSHRFLKAAKTVDWWLLHYIRSLTAKLEVRDRTAWEWNNALLQGFSAWRALRRNGGGVVHGDLHSGTIKFVGP